VKAILLGAGRGKRLGPHTLDCPKSLVPFGGRRLGDFALEAMAHAGIRDVIYVGGWQVERVRAQYPNLHYVVNERWAETNILASLFCAKEHMRDGFVSTYTDIVYPVDVVQRLRDAPGDICLAIDTDWRARYRERSQHPETDGEKVRASGGRILEISRTIDPAEAHGEFIGVARFTKEGARVLIEHHAAAQLGPNAYFIVLLERMLQAGVPMTHVDIPGGYWEIDTEEDYRLAERDWAKHVGSNR
jgi:choline kinase